MMTRKSTTPRTLNWDDKAGVLTITERHQIDVYFVEEIHPAPGYGAGRGFELRKHFRTETEGLYHVFAAADPDASTCDCRGFHRWGQCRHAAAMVRVIALGLAPDPRCNGGRDVTNTEVE